MPETETGQAVQSDAMLAALRSAWDAGFDCGAQSGELHANYDNAWLAQQSDKQREWEIWITANERLTRDAVAASRGADGSPRGQL
jgi:hypothetical protein